MSRARLFGLFLVGCLPAPVAAWAHGWERPVAAGGLVEVSVERNGREIPLYPAPDGSGRHYLEAREGETYAVTLHNRTRERLGVVLTVDGLNAVSGTRDEGRGRMYVLEPWSRATVRGWRTSLREVRRFTFVDERRSYAARTGQAGARMGWIEAAVYRERRSVVRLTRPSPDWSGKGAPTEDRESPEPADESAASARAESPAPPAAEGEFRAADRGRASYPGTGWGSRAHDPVVLVHFEPERSPAERVTLRYEYRSALVALGVLPPPPARRDRLWQRDRGEGGFALPPRW